MLEYLTIVLCVLGLSASLSLLSFIFSAKTYIQNRRFSDVIEQGIKSTINNHAQFSFKKKEVVKNGKERAKESDPIPPTYTPPKDGSGPNIFNRRGQK